MIAVDTVVQPEASVLLAYKDKMSLMAGGVATKIQFNEMTVVNSSDPAKILKQVQEDGDSFAIVRSAEGRRMFMFLPDGAVLFKGATFTDMPADDVLLVFAEELKEDMEQREGAKQEWEIAEGPATRLAYSKPGRSTPGAVYYLFQDLCLPYRNPKVLDDNEPRLIYLPPLIVGGNIDRDMDRVISDFRIFATSVKQDVRSMPLLKLGLSNMHESGSVCFGTSETVAVLLDNEKITSPFAKVRTSLFQFLGAEGNLDLLGCMWRNGEKVEEFRRSVGADQDTENSLCVKLLVEKLSTPNGWRSVAFPPLSGSIKPPKTFGEFLCGNRL